MFWFRDLEDVIGIICTGIVLMIYWCFGFGPAAFIGIPMLIGYAQYKFDQDDRNRGL